MRVFLAHSSLDKIVVEQIAISLINAIGEPKSVWFDLWEIIPGDSIVDSIQDGIKKCDVFLAILSTKSNQALWARKEIASALASSISCGTPRVIPFRVEPVDVPPLLKDLKWIDYWMNPEMAIQILTSILREDPQGPIIRPDAKKMLSIAQVERIWNSLSPSGRGAVLIILDLWLKENPLERDYVFPFVNNVSRVSLGGPLEELQDVGLISGVPPADTQERRFRIQLTKTGINFLEFVDLSMTTNYENVEFLKDTTSRGHSD